LDGFLPKKDASPLKKTVLLLGSGMVAAPLVEHLSKRPDVNIVIGNIFIAVVNELNS
jgi:alpha-aminoadipic semialdehyde synthase